MPRRLATGIQGSRCLDVPPRSNFGRVSLSFGEPEIITLTYWETCSQTQGARPRSFVLKTEVCHTPVTVQGQHAFL